MISTVYGTALAFIRLSLLYSLFPFTARINFWVVTPNFNYLIIDHVNALFHDGRRHRVTKCQGMYKHSRKG